MLHSLNNQFAIEHEKLQKQVTTLQEKCNKFESLQQNGCDACRLYVKNEETNLKEIEVLSNENKQLCNDVKMMKTLIYRLNVQLERYQEMLRKKPDGTKIVTNRKLDRSSDPNKEIDLTTASISNVNERIHWGTVDSNALAPLLNAYQETINDKIDIIQQYEIELNHTTGYIKDIVSENERLHAEMDNMKRLNDTWISDKTRLQAQLDICR